MLENLRVTCPKCHEPTEVATSAVEGSEPALATTLCRRCGARFLTYTQPDGRVLLLDFEKVRTGASIEEALLGVIAPPPTKSGYRVTPPDWLDLFSRGREQIERVGPSDEELAGDSVRQLEGLLRRPDGSPRAPAEAAKFVGWRAVWIAQLNEAIEARMSAPPPLSFPPGVFISYRWGSEDENAWVARLAGELKSRGYPVTFDRDEPQGVEVDVPQLVSRIADCRYFIAVLDPGYVERIGGPGSDAIKDGWVFDEYNTAAHLSRHDRLRILGFHRHGAGLPSGFRAPEAGRQGNTVDVTTPERLIQVLDDVFPPVEGPSESTATRARQLLTDSHQHLVAGRMQDAFDCASQLTELLPGVIDGRAQEIRVAIAAGAAQVVLASAEAALELAPQSKELLLAAGSSAGDVGDHRRAVAHLARLLEMSRGVLDHETITAHQAIGSALDELEQVEAALAHLRIARAAGPANPGVCQTLGYVLRRAGQPDRAVSCFQEGLQLTPNHVGLLVNLAAALIECGRTDEAIATISELETAAPGHPSSAHLHEVARKSAGQAPPALLTRVSPPEGGMAIECDACEARITAVDEASAILCARCGATALRDARACPHCGSDGRIFAGVPAASFQCPFCRGGTIRLNRQPISPA